MCTGSIISGYDLSSVELFDPVMQLAMPLFYVYSYGYIGVFPTNQPYLSYFLYKSTMTELVSSGYLKSDTPRADMRQAAVVSRWDKGERESREKKGGCRWMRKEGGR